MKYSDVLVDWLVEEGYTHCFYVAGGNIMHLLDSARTRFVCVPFVHEVAVGIAAEYFNEVSDGRRAFALVTAGPGLTNIITAMAGAFLESRELLVLGGQVKSADLATGNMRQRGIQEIDGVALARSLCVETLQIRTPVPHGEFLRTIAKGVQGRKGPVFVEICLDAQGAPVDGDSIVLNRDSSVASQEIARPDDHLVSRACEMLLESTRPVLLVGGGVPRLSSRETLDKLQSFGIPIATTWNGTDRVAAESRPYFGRPNTFGMRWSNLLLQQADMILAVGTRLGLQQTGFNWQGFAPLARVIQVDLDEAELSKGHPIVDLAVCSDALEFLRSLTYQLSRTSLHSHVTDAWRTWAEFGWHVRETLPVAEACNTHNEAFIDPYGFVQELSVVCHDTDVVIPCSSGGAFTVMMQAFEQKAGQIVVTDKGLASMGYGLSGAIGAALAKPDSRTILVEGDGGFAQNLQELGTVKSQAFNLKIFIFANQGYASIRMTQRNYFGGSYMGCDTATGLGLPDWPTLFAAYGIPSLALSASLTWGPEVMNLMQQQGPAAFIVPIDPEQTYFPKINSRVTDSGAMESTPLHVMFPPLPEDVVSEVTPFLRGEAL